MARGTNRDNRITQWSVNSIEQRTNISRPNASKAVKFLLERGIWKRTRGGKHPVYESVPGDQIPDGPFTSEQHVVLGQIRSGAPLLDIATAKMLVARGLAIELQQTNSHRSFELDESAIAELVERKAVWLPNALIDGAAGRTNKGNAKPICPADDHRTVRDTVPSTLWRRATRNAKGPI